MVGWPGPALARAGARIAALTLLLASVLPVAISASRVFAAGCTGDEQILLVPTQPSVGSQMIVAAVSRYAHEDVILIGPDGPLDVKRVSVGDRYVWQATLVPGRAGEHLFAFGVAGVNVPLVTCADARTQVSDSTVASVLPASEQPGAANPADAAAGDAATTSALVAMLNPYDRSTSLASAPNESAAAPFSPVDGLSTTIPTVIGETESGAPQPTDTRRPTRTPTRRPASSKANDNGNENANDNARDPTPTRSPTNTRTPTATREPTETRAPTSTRTPRPEPTDTPAALATDAPAPTPTWTPRPDPTDTPVRSPTPTRTPRPDPTDTPIPTPTPTLAPPSIADWAPESAMCGQSLTIRGERFGANRLAVDGRVTVDGRDTEVLAWAMTQVTIKVPLTARPGNDRELMMIVSERVVTSAKLRISC